MKVNYRFLVILMIGCAVIGSVVVAMHSAQASRNASLVLERARAAAESGASPDALRLFRRYLGLNPAADDVRYEYAKLLDSVGQWEDAFFQFESVIRSDSSYPQARDRLVDIAMRLGRYTDARTHLRKHLLVREPNNVRFLRLLANCDIHTGEYDRARATLEKAAEIEPGDCSTISELCNLLTDRYSDPGTAERRFDELIAQSPDSPDCYVTRGKWLLRRVQQLSDMSLKDKFVQLASSDLSNAHRLDPANRNAALLAVELATLSRESSSALPMVQTAIANEPEVPELYGGLAQLAMIDEEYQAAIGHLRAGLRAVPGDVDLIWNLANLEIEQGNIDTTLELANELRQRGYANAPVLYLDALVCFENNEWSKAVEIIENSRAQFDRSDAELLKRSDLLLAHCYRKMGQHDQEIIALRRAVSLSPLRRNTRYLLAAALLRTGRLQESMVEFNHLCQIQDPPVGALVALARLKCIAGIHSNLDSDWVAVESLLQRLESVPEAAVDLAVLRAEVLVAKGNNEKAVSLLTEVINEKPGELAARLALISLLIQTREFDQAENLITQSVECMGDGPKLRIARARCLLRRYGGELDVASLDEMAIPASDWTVDDCNELSSDFAALFMALDECERASICAGRLTDNQDVQLDLPLQLLLFDLAFRSQEVGEMEQALDKIKRIEGVGPLWRVGEAIRLSVNACALADRQNAKRADLFQSAIDHLALAGLARPEWPRVPRLQGEVYDSWGRTDLAIERYAEAIALGERDPRVITRAVLLLFERQRFLEADNIVRKLQEQRTPFSQELTRVASQVSLQLENFDRALNLAKDRAESSSKLNDHVWLAQVLWITGSQEEAHSEFQRAIQMDRTAPLPWVSLVQMYVRNKELGRARETINEAKEAIRPDVMFDALGQCYQAIGDAERASDCYQKAIDQHPNDLSIKRKFASFLLETGDRVSAIPLLESICDERRENADADQAWARRNLALSLGTGDRESDFVRAKSLLDLNIELLGEGIEDRRCLAVILANRNDVEHVSEAIRILNQVNRRRSKFSIPDNSLLARLYLKQGDWTSYCRTMRGILANGGASDSAFVFAYTRSLIEHDELVEAQLWMDRLKEVAAEDWSTVSLEADLLFQRGEHTQLIKILRDALQDDSRKEWAIDVAEACGVGLRNQGLHNDSQPFLEFAANGYLELSQATPERAIDYAIFLARSGKAEDAFNIIAGKSIRSSQLAELVNASIQGNALQPKQVAALVKLSEQALAKKLNRDLQVGLADLHAWQGDLPAAVDRYLQVLKQEPTNVIALNNLAVVCALSGEQVALAEQSIERAIAVAGANGSLLDTRGLVRLAAGKHEIAEQDFRMAMKSSEPAHLSFHLALALVAQDRIGDARRAFQAAEESGLAIGVIHPLERVRYQKLKQRLRISQATAARLPAAS